MWGAARIVLLGYDMQPGPKGEIHHHGAHKGLPNPGPDFAEWARRFIALGADLREQGVTVINATTRTAITCFERQSIDVALAGDKPPAARTAALQVRTDLLPREYAAFESGLKAGGYRIVGLDEDPDITVAWSGQPAKGQVLVAENRYMDGQGGPYCALAIGGHNGAGRAQRGDSARLARLGVAFKPWRETGQHILICPSRGIGAMPQPEDWLERTVEEIRRYTDLPIQVRPHPGNWKANKPAVALEDDLRGAWACVIWASTSGISALIEGVPVIYTAPHWICADAAGNKLADIESPPMPDRTPAFERMAAAQWSLDEIASGEAFRALLGGELTVLCVLKSGGDYNAEYVRKLRDGVARHLTIPHRFVCISDVPVPCERIQLKHNWPGWWSKMEIFRPDVITGPTLYLDLDTILVGNIDRVASIPYDFAMLNIREKDMHIGNSGAIWLTKPFAHVYERFAEKPEHWINYHARFANDRYMGDQAFISDCFERIPKLHHAVPGMFQSYKYDRLQSEVPQNCAVVCFGGHPRPHEAGGWVKGVWV